MVRRARLPPAHLLRRLGLGSERGVLRVLSRLGKYLALADTWNERVIARILAEESINAYATTWSVDGNNGVCDEASTQVGEYSARGGYCLWCPESDVIAWYIGFAAWAADQIVGEFPSRYGYTPLYEEDIENLQACPGYSFSAWNTPGMFAAVLRDISDATNEHGTIFGGPGWDDLSMGPDPILGLFAGNTMSTPGEFFDVFRATYPELCSELSHTALNNGYIIDGAPPSTVTDLATPSHTVGVASTDATVDLAWTRHRGRLRDRLEVLHPLGAAADPSRQHCRSVGRGLLHHPDTSPGDLLHLHPIRRRREQLGRRLRQPGAHHHRPPGAGQPHPRLQSGWAYRVVPRAAADAASGNVPFPAGLTGDAAAT